MTRLCHFLLLLVFACLGAGTKVGAEDAWPSGRAVKVGTITHNPPYVIQYRDTPDRPSAGIDLDLIAAAFDRVGLNVSFQHAPLSRVQVLLETGKVDAMTTFRTIDGLCKNSDIFSYWHDGITVPVDSTKVIRSIKDLKGLRVGMFPGAVKVLNYLTEADLQTFKSSMIVYDREQLIKVLLYRRLDAYIGDYWALEYAYRQLASDKPKPYRVAVAFDPTPRQLCIRDDALAALFNKGVQAIKTDGTLEIVNARYLGEDMPQVGAHQFHIDGAPAP